MTNKKTSKKRHDPPAPGLDGTYRDSCVVCFRGTDTGLAFSGEGEWAIAGLAALGVPSDHASKLVSLASGIPHGMVPTGRVTVAFRVCAKCAAKSGFPVGDVRQGLPTIQPR